MAWHTALLLMLLPLCGFLALGLPVAFTFFVVNIIGAMVFLGGEAGLAQMVRNSVTALTNYSLAPIPLFILMGEILLHSGVAFRAIDAIEKLIAKVPGRLPIVSVCGGTVFAALSGSSLANTAMLGSALLPDMLKRGYDPRLAMGPIMATGGIAMLIPPSALAVLLGSLAGISITGLLVAGVLPGLLLSALFVGYIVMRCSLNPALAPRFEQQSVVGWARWRALLLYVTPLVGIFVVVVVAMSAGWATPTESAAIGALATVAVCVAYRSLSWRALLDALRGTAAISGMILFIIIGATTFSQILSFSGGTNGLVTLVRDSGLSAFGVLLVMMAILLVLGCFIDQVSTMLITLPFYMPLVQHYGFDPLWFGVMYLICMQLGLLTPPFGMLLFTMRSVAPPHISTRQIYAAVTPYVVFGMLMLAAVMAVPGLATWLPQWLLAK